jgi:hypothetical protein
VFLTEMRRLSFGVSQRAMRRLLPTTSEGRQAGAMVATENGRLKITARDRNPAGLPLEWIEVNIS